MLKHTITVVAGVAVAIAIGITSVVSYNHYKNWSNEQAAKATKASQAEAKANTLEQAIFNSNLAKLEAQCAKDQADYSALTVAQRTKTVAPDCSTNLVQ